MAVFKLDIPYLSQWSDAQEKTADSGLTCVSMLLNALGHQISPQALLSTTEEAPRQFSTLRDIRQAAMQSGKLQFTYHQYGNGQAALSALRKHLQAQHGVIILAHYGAWRERTGNPFSGAQFVLPVGFDEELIYLHDPLFGLWQPQAGGAYLDLPLHQFLDGWGGFSLAENPNFVCLVTKRPFPLQGEPRPPFIQDATAQLKQKINALAAFEGLPAPDLRDAETAVYWQERTRHWPHDVRSYTVGVGDTLGGIAYKHYGSATRWQIIQAFNELPNATLFVGQTLQIPLIKPADNTQPLAADQPAIIDPDIRVPLPGFGGPEKVHQPDAVRA